MFDEFKPIDTDTHLTEPPDTWTSRVAKKWADKVPQVKRVNGRDLWFINGVEIAAPGAYTMAGFDGSFPDTPNTFEELPKSAYDPHARLAFMDKEGIYAQVLYPNVGGFGSGGFLKLKDPELMLECVKAYNNFLADWTSPNPNRLLGGAAMPFWDVKECVKEIDRAAKLGHKTILACTKPEDYGMPHLAHPHWDPYWAAIQETGLPVSFHIGGGSFAADALTDRSQMGLRPHFAGQSTLLFMGNVQCLTEILFGGVCHRFPKLKMFSVESGIGWLPSFLELCDWQWTNGQGRKDRPEYDLLPSEYFRRQIYASFWFETQKAGIEAAIKLYPDNIMWETDYPHPTSQSPGLTGGWGQHPRDYATNELTYLGKDALKKVLHTNAVRCFQLAA